MDEQCKLYNSTCTTCDCPKAYVLCEHVLHLRKQIIDKYKTICVPDAKKVPKPSSKLLGNYQKYCNVAKKENTPYQKYLESISEEITGNQLAMEEGHWDTEVIQLKTKY